MVALSIEQGHSISDHCALPPERIELRGLYVSLSPLSNERANDLYGFVQDPGAKQLFAYLPYGPFENFPAYQNLIMQFATSQDPLFFALIDNESGKAVGHLALMRIDCSNRVIEIGHILYTPKLQRHTGATEAVYLSARYVFEQLGYRRLEWKCNNLNLPSKRAAERFGFQFEGLFRQHMIVKGHNRDTAWFSMLDYEWPLHKATFEAWLLPENFDAHGRQRRNLNSVRSRIKQERFGS